MGLHAGSTQVQAAVRGEAQAAHAVEQRLPGFLGAGLQVGKQVTT